MEDKPTSANSDLEIQMLKCQVAHYKLSTLNQQAGTIQEAYKRATIEVQTLPEKLEKIRQEIETLQAEVKPMYASLKEMVGCPEDKDVDLLTGQIINR